MTGRKDSSVIDVFASEAWDPRRMQMVDMAARVQFSFCRLRQRKPEQAGQQELTVSSELD